MFKDQGRYVDSGYVQTIYLIAHVAAYSQHDLAHVVISNVPHDGQAVPQSAEALVDVVGFFLPCACRPRPSPSAALAAREVNDPEVGVFALRAHELDLSSQSPRTVKDT